MDVPGRQLENAVRLPDPVRGKPRPSGRGRIARTAQPSLVLVFSAAAAAVQ